MRRLLLSVGLALAVGGATLGAAASLTLDPTSLSAGSTVVTSCDSGTADVAWESAWYSDVTPGYFRVTEVTVSDLDAACADKFGAVVLRNTANTQLAQIYGGTWNALTSSFTFNLVQPWLSPVRASDVTWIDVAIFNYS
jgi:hypothetical protein